MAAIMPLRARAESVGSGDFSPLWAGQNTSGCKEISAAALTRELADAVRGVDQHGSMPAS
jgi:nitronate monooxygenase